MPVAALNSGNKRLDIFRVRNRLHQYVDGFGVASLESAAAKAAPINHRFSIANLP